MDIIKKVTQTTSKFFGDNKKGSIPFGSPNL